MKQQIRLGVFETNSSSVHSITMVDKSDYEKFKKGTVWFMDDYFKGGKFLEVNNAIEENVKILKSDYEVSDEFIEIYRQEKNLDDAVAKYDNNDLDYYDFDLDSFYMSYDEYFDRIGNEYETYEKEYKAKNGTEIVAFGYYGHD